jgi:hypothetical protein
LYGLKQSPRLWNKAVDAQLKKMGFAQSLFDPALYIRRNSSGIMYLLLWVDDLLMVSSSAAALQDVKNALLAVWDMKDLGPVGYYLGLNIIRDRSRRQLWIGQPKYITSLLEKYDFDFSASPPTLSVGGGRS